MLFVGVCAVRKGVHFALEAWLGSPACQDGTFLIAGEFLPDYQQKLAAMLSTQREGLGSSKRRSGADATERHSGFAQY